jgi:hypothetical protein
VVLALTTRLAAAGRAIDLMEAPPAILLARLQRRQLDAALTLLRGDGSAPGARALHRESYLVALPPAHAMAGHSRVAAADLSATAFILRTHCEVDADARRRFIARGVRPPVVARTASDARALALVAAGIGACLLPESLIDASMSAVAVTDLRLDRRLGLALRPGLDADLVDLLRDAVRALPWTPARPDSVVAH